MTVDEKRNDSTKLRREAIEEKKKKLEELRAQKSQKEKDIASRRKDGGAVKGATKATSAVVPSSQDVDDMVKSLLGDDAKRERANGTISTDELADRERRQRAAKMAALASQHNVVNINIPSKDIPTYDRGIQTIESESSGSRSKSSSTTPRSKQSEGQDREKREDREKDEQKEEEPEKFVIPELPESVKQTILASHDFTHFFNKASRVVERALTLRYDITKDFSADESNLIGADKVVKEDCYFYDETLCKHRAVTDISWSPKHPEIVVVAYSERLSGGSDEGKEGMVILWNMMTPGSPEMIFYCPSSVLRAFISHFNPNLVVASTYSGQIVVWDKSRLNEGREMLIPTQRTPLSPNGHTLPVFSMDLVGTDNANSLVTISTDGKMRSWNLQNLVEPQDPKTDLLSRRRVQQVKDQDTQAEPIAVTCSSFVDGDANTVIIGAEDTDLYTIARHTTNADPIQRRHVGHDGPVTGVSCHPASITGSIDFSAYFLSCSMDWTIRLWDRKHEKPLHTIDYSNDYVYDVKWSPTHPSVFASVDGTGHLSIWDMNQEIDLPIGKVLVSKNNEERALNRVQFSRDGKKIAVGTSHGYCHIFDAKREIATPKDNDQPKKLRSVLEELLMKMEDADPLPS